MDEAEFFLGYGYGSGDGSGSGNGSGSGYGDEISLITYRGRKVRYVDGIPCVVDSAHESFAAVRVIDTQDFSARDAFVGKFCGCMAHGETIRDAVSDAREKFMSGLDYGSVRERLLAEFRDKGRLTVRELYAWHGALTGSCRFGRTEFQKRHGLDDGDELTLGEFVALCRDEFGGDKIAMLEQ